MQKELSRDDLMKLILASSLGFDANSEGLQHGCIQSNPYRGEYWEWNIKSFDGMSCEELSAFYDKIKTGKLVDPDYYKKIEKFLFTPLNLPIVRRQFPSFDAKPTKWKHCRRNKK